MKKILISFIIGCSAVAHAQYYGGGWSSYGNFLRYATPTDKTVFGINQFFGSLEYSMNHIRSSNAIERNLAAQRNQLENYKSIKNFYTTGIPPFASHGPDGKARSPKITWEEVHKIDGEGFIE